MRTRLLDLLIAGVLSTGFASTARAASSQFSVTLWNDNVESSTSVSNASLFTVHAPLQIDGWDDDFALPTHTDGFSVGDGRHGVFDDTTAANFHDGVYNNDGIIRINTDTFSNLQFKSFTLPTGWQIIPTGTRPLIIRSQSTVTIAGQIMCNGGAGADIGSSLTPAGGTPRCGGSRGGEAGTALLTATAGTQSTTNPAIAGGGAGASQGDGDGGGGGAGMDQAAPGPTSGINGGITAGGGGTAGLGGNDSSFATEGGGAGGGGGAAFTDISDPAGASTGAGGGAGGGSVYIYSVGNQLIAGTITADGGAGGGGLAPAKGGGGGGGAGGSILLFSGGSVTINGFVTAVGGLGGVSPGGDGGVGGSGRTWVTDVDGVPTLAAFNSLEPLGILPTWGQVNYQTGSFELVTKTMDLGNSRPILDSIAVTATMPGASTYSMEVASSDAPFTAAAAVWVPSTSLVNSRIKRYVRVRISLNNQDATTSAKITAMTINYTPGEQTEFEFASCNAATVGTPPPSGPTRLMMLLAMLLPIAATFALREGSRRGYQPAPK